MIANKLTPSVRPTGSNRLHRALLPLYFGVIGILATGCSSLTMPIDGIPARRVPPQFLAPPKNDLVPIDISLLTQEPPRNYQVDAGDILGVYVEGVLPFNPPDLPPEPPPVNFPEGDSILPPSIGYPIPVQEDGTLSLPEIEPLQVRGLTLEQVRDRIRRAYIDEAILLPEKARPIVTLIKERTYNIIVIRQDMAGMMGAGGGGAGMAQMMRGGGGGMFRGGVDQTGRGSMVKLPAYQNDILHALVETGGLPGLSARNEVQILRASEADKRARAEFIQKFYASQKAAMLDPCICPPPLPDDPTILRIPLRLPPGMVPDIRPEDVLLEEGDIVYIESREAEVFYTGGLLPGGEHIIPRDYDLDALGAMAIAGGGIGGPMGGGGGFGVQSVGGVPPGRLFILRRLPCNNQIAIEVDIARAMNNPRERPLIQSGDTLILQYKPEEEVLNFAVGTFFTFGIRELLRSR